MPKTPKLEEALKRAARARGYPPGSKQYNAYVYGTLARVKGGKDATPRK